MIKLIKSLREKVSRKVLAVSVAIAAAVAAPAAFAVDPAGVDPAALAKQGFIQLTNTYTGMSGDAWKYLVGVVVGFAVMGLFKKFVTKST
ncbi:hypothetical protein I0N36_004862 [Salmonella enterica]|nr:hypothetical protein [Salmonella enterica]